MSLCLCVSGGGDGGGVGGGAVEDKRGQRGAEGEERRKGHSNFGHVQCLLFFVHISDSKTCIATR